MSKCKFGNIVKWTAPKDVRHKGQFAFAKLPNNFYYCRELFMNDWLKKKNTRRIIMSLGTGNGPETYKKRRIAVASLMWEIEEQLGIPDERKTLFNETTFERVLRVKVSTFWMREPMRQSLFTLLLRAGVGSKGKQYNPNKDNLDSCISSQKLLKPTTKAVKRFLDGKTHFAGTSKVTGHNGWNQQLRDGSCDLKTILKKKPKKTVQV